MPVRAARCRARTAKPWRRPRAPRAGVPKSTFLASRSPPMRHVRLAIIVLPTALVLGVKRQNPASVTLRFFSFGLSPPVTLLIVRACALGMFTGGSLWSLLERSYRGARPHRRSAAARAEPGQAAHARALGLGFARARRGVRDQRRDQPARRRGHLVHGALPAQWRC
jgi:hypothetical protein